MCKKLICLTSFIVMLALAGNAAAQIDPASISDGHVYLFDNVSAGQVPDDSANSNAGSEVGNPIVVDGLRGKALLFDGTDDGVNIPDSANINITNGPFPNRTIMAVFKCDDVTKQEKQTIVDEGGRTRGLVIYVFDGQVYVGGWNRAEYNWNPGSWISAPINSNQWYTVALVIRDGHEAEEADKFEMWLDGELIGKAPGGHIHNHSNNNAIGYTQELTVFHDNDGNGDGWYFDGAIDEVWFLNDALAERELRAFVGKLWPYAAGPTPANGVIVESTWTNLAWAAGDLAVSHDVYFGTSFDDVNDGAEGTFAGNTGSTFQVVGFTGFPAPEGLEPGTMYYWRVDEINNDDQNSPWKGEVWSFMVPPLTAYNPDPSDGMRFVDADPTLSWSRGYESKLHTVYLGDDPAEVEAGNATTSGPVSETTFAPGTLDFDKTYYWRVDEFDGANTYQGEVWSFRTVPEITINEDPNLVAWWKIDEGIGKRAIDWSGHGNHVIFFDPIWTEPGKYGNTAVNLNGRFGSIQNLSYAASDLTGVTVCAWVRTTSGSDQYIVSFDRDNYYRLEINGSGAGAGQVGWDVMTSSGQVDYGSVSRVDDGQWHHVAGVFDNGFMIIYVDGVAEPSTTGGTTFGSGTTRFGFIGANSEATGFDGSRGGGSPVVGELDDIRIYDRALTQAELALVMRGDLRFAWAPSPTDGSVTGINVASALSWSAGEGASQHDVYFGTDRAAVADADAADTSGLYKGRLSTASYAPDGVTENSGPYYWRIDEIAGDGSIIKGNVWSFSAADYVLIDDFESYNDIPAGEEGSNLIYLTWLDGLETPMTNGSIIGYNEPFMPTMESSTVFDGGQSVPLFYNNTVASYSEITANVANLKSGRDWSKYGAKGLTLRFYGDPNNSVNDQMYVKVNGSKVMYDSDVENFKQPAWQMWYVDLASLGVNLTSVTELSIGFDRIGAFGGQGVVLLDGIRLYAYERQLVTPAETEPDSAGLVVHWSLDEGSGTTVRDISGNGYDAAFTGDPQWVQGYEGTAMNFDGIDDSVIARLPAEETWQAYTVSVWAKADTLWQAANSCVFANHTTYSTSTPSMQISFDSINNYQFHGSVDEIIGPATTDWVHLTVASDGPAVTVYYNGILVSSVATGAGDPVFDKFAIGINRAEDNWFDGAVDDLRVYDRVLTPEEIAGLAGLTQPFDKGF